MVKGRGRQPQRRNDNYRPGSSGLSYGSGKSFGFTPNRQGYGLSMGSQPGGQYSAYGNMQDLSGGQDYSPYGNSSQYGGNSYGGSNVPNQMTGGGLLSRPGDYSSPMGGSYMTSGAGSNQPSFGGYEHGVDNYRMGGGMGGGMSGGMGGMQQSSTSRSNTEEQLALANTLLSKLLSSQQQDGGRAGGGFNNYGSGMSRDGFMPNRGPLLGPGPRPQQPYAQQYQNNRGRGMVSRRGVRAPARTVGRAPNAVKKLAKKQPTANKVKKTIADRGDNELPPTMMGCKLCNIFQTNSEAMYKAHLKNDKHQNMLKLMKKRLDEQEKLIHIEIQMEHLKCNSRFVSSKKDTSKMVAENYCAICKAHIIETLEKHSENDALHKKLLAFNRPSCCNQSFSSAYDYEVHTMDLEHLQVLYATYTKSVKNVAKYVESRKKKDKEVEEGEKKENGEVEGKEGMEDGTGEGGKVEQVNGEAMDTSEAGKEDVEKSGGGDAEIDLEVAELSLDEKDLLVKFKEEGIANLEKGNIAIDKAFSSVFKKGEQKRFKSYQRMRDEIHPKALDEKLPDFYDPTTPVGLHAIRPVSGFYCQVCQRFFLLKSQVYDHHIKTRAHYTRYCKRLGLKANLKNAQTAKKIAAAKKGAEAEKADENGESAADTKKEEGVMLTEEVDELMEKLEEKA